VESSWFWAYPEYAKLSKKYLSEFVQVLYLRNAFSACGNSIRSNRSISRHSVALSKSTALNLALSTHGRCFQNCSEHVSTSVRCALKTGRTQTWSEEDLIGEIFREKETRSPEDRLTQLWTTHPATFMADCLTTISIGLWRNYIVI
jgi:hypothetical protein